MSLGLQEAARRASRQLIVRLAVDTEQSAIDVFKWNFAMCCTRKEDVTNLFPGVIGEPLRSVEEEVAAEVGHAEFLVGGPPCQGHSNLNNHTRRRDPKNALYLKMARATEVLLPDVVVIENVPPVQWDSEDVVGETVKALRGLGYDVDTRVLLLARLGVPQNRKRFILLATRLEEVHSRGVLDELQDIDVGKRDVRWAIDDLRKAERDLEIDQPSRMSEDNRRRVEHLFRERRYDLPDEERPPCHRDRKHSYKSVYGRLRWDDPAPTITTGFTSMGQGRYVHPSQRRTLTPHEAARLQTFPDWFRWGPTKRTHLARLIGNAVPPLLMARLGEIIIPAITEATEQRSRWEIEGS